MKPSINVRLVKAALQHAKIETDLASPNFVADFAVNRGFQLTSEEVVEVSNSYEYTETIELDYSQIEDPEVDGINTRDYPDFSDAYVASATYMGRPMTEEELEVLNEDGSYVNELVHNRLF